MPFQYHKVCSTLKTLSSRSNKILRRLSSKQRQVVAWVEAIHNSTYPNYWCGDSLGKIQQKNAFHPAVDCSIMLQQTNAIYASHFWGSVKMFNNKKSFSNLLVRRQSSSLSPSSLPKAVPEDNSRSAFWRGVPWPRQWLHIPSHDQKFLDGTSLHPLAVDKRERHHGTSSNELQPWRRTSLSALPMQRRDDVTCQASARPQLLHALAQNSAPKKQVVEGGPAPAAGEPLAVVAWHCRGCWEWWRRPWLGTVTCVRRHHRSCGVGSCIAQPSLCSSSLFGSFWAPTQGALDYLSLVSGEKGTLCLDRSNSQSPVLSLAVSRRI